MKNFVNRLRLLLVFSFIISMFSFSAFAAIYNENEPNDDFATAYNIGTWSPYNSIFGQITSDQAYNIDFYRFSASQGDQLAISLSSMREGDNVDLYLYDSNFRPVDKSTRNMNVQEVVRVDVPVSGTYYIEVRPVSMSSGKLNAYYISFFNRIKTGTYTATLSPTSLSRTGNGTYSAVATVNLINEAAIPEKAIVKRIEATGTISPSLGHTFIQVMNDLDKQWYESISGSGLFKYVTENNNLLVKTKWSVRYYSFALAKSTWASPKLHISYTYDQTLGW